MAIKVACLFALIIIIIIIMFSFAHLLAVRWLVALFVCLFVYFCACSLVFVSCFPVFVGFT